MINTTEHFRSVALGSVRDDTCAPGKRLARSATRGFAFDQSFVPWHTGRTPIDYAAEAVSMAVCRAGAAASKMPLYKYIARPWSIVSRPFSCIVSRVLR